MPIAKQSLNFHYDAYFVNSNITYMQLDRSCKVYLACKVAKVLHTTLFLEVWCFCFVLFFTDQFAAHLHLQRS